MRAFTASPGRSDLLLPCVLLLGLHAAPGVAQVISYEEAAREAAADAEVILTVTVRALLSGGDAVPGDNLMGQRVRQLAADRESGRHGRWIRKAETPDLLHPPLTIGPNYPYIERAGRCVDVSRILPGPCLNLDHDQWSLRAELRSPGVYRLLSWI